MKKLLFIIVSDPIKSHKAAEAIRIAAGLCALQHPTSIVVYKTACNLFTEPIYKFIDSDIIEQSLPTLQKLNIPLYFINDNKVNLNDTIKNPSHALIEKITWEKLCYLIEEADAIFIF